MILGVHPKGLIEEGLTFKGWIFIIGYSEAEASKITWHIALPWQESIVRSSLGIIYHFALRTHSEQRL